MLLWEIWSYAQIPFFWWAFRRFLRRDIKGDIIAGAMIGGFIEFSTEPLWDYHFKFTIYKDIPPSVPLGWGVMLAMVVYVSEKLYCLALGRKDILPHDRRIFIFDVIGGTLVGVPLEAIGLRAGVWSYNYDILHWTWGTVPFLRMPYEALFGYALLMLTAPTFVRYWQKSLDGVRLRA